MSRRHAGVGVCAVALLTVSAADLPRCLPGVSEVGASPVPRCVCKRGVSVAHLANDADLLAIGVVETHVPRQSPNGEGVSIYRIRLTRAWRWPGSAPTPPQYVEVYSFGQTSCSGYVGRGEPYVVQAQRVSVPRTGANTVLSLAGRCSLGGPADTAGAVGTMLRAEYGEERFRRWARERNAELDSLRIVLGPGVEPTR